jgi:two-component system, OmpR family, alkaline phosphatase synthesis response regulator PhoP
MVVYARGPYTRIRKITIARLTPVNEYRVGGPTAVGARPPGPVKETGSALLSSPGARVETRATVLVIDDDADHRASVKSLLEAEGYAVDTASSGEEGLRVLQRHRPDVIILDVMMESIMEGYAVNQAIKFQPEFEAYADIPIVMVSSIQESPDERFSRAAEAELIRPNRYLTKPLDIPVFLAVLEKATRRRMPAR